MGLPECGEWDKCAWQILPGFCLTFGMDLARKLGWGVGGG
jgi:hypothetical protein